MSGFTNDAIFWVEVEKIKPNPYQPRREFDEERLSDLAESIRQYGVLQPLVVTRKEIYREDGGISVEYELIAGERRHRASRLAGLLTVPVIIKDMRNTEEDDQLKLELAIIENLQREDINVVDRARAFQQLVEKFSLKHAEIAKKVGKSREYVSNTIRILNLPNHMLEALAEGKISEGHTRPLLMLSDKPEEQETMFKEIILKRMSVRTAEQIGRRIAFEKVRKQSRAFRPEFRQIEEKLSESLGTRVYIEHFEGKGGHIVIDFFSEEDIHELAKFFELGVTQGKDALLKKHLEAQQNIQAKRDPFASYKEELGLVEDENNSVVSENETNTAADVVATVVTVEESVPNNESGSSTENENVEVVSEEAPESVSKEENEDLYSISNFSL